MPRGVYDRSKAKPRKAAATPVTSDAPKKRGRPRKNPLPVEATAATTPKKRGRPPGRPSLNKSAADKTPKKIKATPSTDLITLFQEIRANLGTLVMVGEKFGDLPQVKDEVEAQVSILSSLRHKMFGESDEEQDHADAPVDPNGTQFFPPTVPLPPAPNVVPPPTH